ncbi:MAG: ABC transporter ATP-binding protein [Clostridia bacterium]|nr:ABC transporter ATP-binding protein [Clostridia bacterium]
MEGRVILKTVDLIKQYRQYDTVVTAVDRANLEICDGEFVAIIGRSGSGKSTLLSLMGGLDRPNSGKVFVRGTEITALDADELAVFRGNYLGTVFQNHNLIPQFTALENILIPTLMCRKEEYSYEEHLKKLVSTLRIADRLHHLPSELSGGQQQRVAIARALINRPQVVFADEPTGNLDAENAREVLELLLRTKEAFNQTLVIVTHDMSIAERADRILVMEEGRVSPYREKRKAKPDSEGKTEVSE